MILKFLRNKKGGSTASIDYLLNKKRVEDGTAKILRGDEKQTRDIIKSITKKQKVTFGVLSFEEKDIPKEQKQELMDEFERTFCAGLEKEQYNILWVEHTDKGRLELNFIIPKVELSTGRSFNPYFHGTDFHLADLFQRTANLKYNFTDPKDPSKSQSVQGEYKKTGVMKDYEELDKLLHKMVAENTISSRAELVGFLKDNGIEVPRVGKDYISVKLDSKYKAKRLKGGIYADKFTKLEELETISREQEEAERNFNARDITEELESTRERLEKAISKRAGRNRKIYSTPKKRNNKATQKSSEARNELDRQVSGDVCRSDKQLSRDVYGSDKQPNEEDKGVLDEFRGYAQGRAREREELLSSARENIRKERTSIPNEFEIDREQLFKQAQGAVRRRRSRRRERKENSHRIAKIMDTIGSIGEQVRQFSSGNFKRLGKVFESFGERFVGKIKHRSTNFHEQSSSFGKKVEEVERKAQQILEDREEPDEEYSFGMKM